MSLFDFLFPEQAQASHLRQLAESNKVANTQARLARSRQQKTHSSSEVRIKDLEDEVAQLTITIEALLEKLSDDGSLTRSELAQKIAEIDARDGIIDGQITKHQKTSKTPFKPKLDIPES